MKNQPSKYKIAVIDDHALFAGSLEKLINSFPDFETLFHLRNGFELKKKLAEGGTLPDIILLDINMPVLNGFETAEWLRSSYPIIKFMALTMEDDELKILKMLQLGAKGYLLKDIEPEELNTALLAVINQGYYHTENVSKALVNSLGHQEHEEIKNLKDNEITFIKLASSEMTYKEIADVMHLSPKTIDGYRQELFNRFNH